MVEKDAYTCGAGQGKAGRNAANRDFFITLFQRLGVKRFHDPNKLVRICF